MGLCDLGRYPFKPRFWPSQDKKRCFRYWLANELFLDNEIALIDDGNFGDFEGSYVISVSCRDGRAIMRMQKDGCGVLPDWNCYYLDDEIDVGS